MQARAELARTKLSPEQVARLLPEVGDGEVLALRMWQLLGNRLDWAGLELLIELHDLGDPEALVSDLLTIRNATKE